MKKYLLIATACAVAAGLAIGLGVSVSTAQEEVSDQKTLMKRKLNVAKTLLEGLALEDYSKISASAEQLSMISMEAQWTELLSPRYGRFGSEFRTAVERVKDMADKENLDGATLNFMEVVMACVRCHTAVRGEENIAALQGIVGPERI